VARARRLGQLAKRELDEPIGADVTNDIIKNLLPTHTA
jgi:hypothetical protein